MTNSSSRRLGFALGFIPFVLMSCRADAKNRTVTVDVSVQPDPKTHGWQCIFSNARIDSNETVTASGSTIDLTNLPHFKPGSVKRWTNFEFHMLTKYFMGRANDVKGVVYQKDPKPGIPSAESQFEPPALNGTGSNKIGFLYLNSANSTTSLSEDVAIGIQFADDVKGTNQTICDPDIKNTPGGSGGNGGVGPGGGGH